MKVLIGTLLTLSVGTAFAATTTATVPSSTGTSATTLESVAPKKSPLSFKYEGYVEKSQAAIDGAKSDIDNENDLKITYKASDTQSVRLFLQAVNKVKEDPKEEDVKTSLGNVYLQYAHSGIATVGSQAVDLAVRQYLPVSDAYRDAGQTYQTRVYLSSDFKLNERVTVTPFLNPRFYGGSGLYRNTPKKLEAMFVTLVETSVTLTDRLSWVTDLARFDKNYYVGGTGLPGHTYYVESWMDITLADKTSLTEKITLDVGFFNENGGNGLSFNKDSGELAYFSRLHVNF
jgi:hypothetical protein